MCKDMANESVWVICFNKKTGIREKFTCCQKCSAKFYEELYRGDGYNVMILSDEEVDDMIENEKSKSL